MAMGLRHRSENRFKTKRKGPADATIEAFAWQPTTREGDAIQGGHHAVAVVQASSLDAAVSILGQFTRRWPVGHSLRLGLAIDQRGYIGGEDRVRLWRAANRAWRVGVHVEPVGDIAADLLQRDAYEFRRRERACRKASSAP